jgi:hypothetical protein
MVYVIGTEHEELAGYRQLSVNEKATVMVVGNPEPPLPRVPEAMICGEDESATAPDTQLPVILFPGVREVHCSLTAPTGTVGQPASVPAVACTLTAHVPLPFPFNPQLTDAVVLPGTGDASGSEELNAMVEGATVTPLMVTPPWADKTPAKTSAGSKRTHFRKSIMLPRS